ncbi:vacuolar sorting-associated 13c [Brachionus plicatilis]|uniref:Vacuolar sorting-associated 13c n=1 Tax=Brachionus plicatilis TaxID=10195 RepID=A0A3M7SLD0_BRAPC|nr:vacuolar sorting-associated 13c [Brachionus plicatilis]
MDIYKCATCKIRFNKSSKSSQAANRNKCCIKNSWLVHSIRTQGIDPALYKWICCSCHKAISRSCPDKNTNNLFYDLAVSEITEEIQNNLIPLVLEETFQIPQSTSKLVSLDFADIDDERSSEENPLKDEVKMYSKRLSNKRIVDLNEFVFPKISEEYIKSITFGIYQLKQSISYSLEHINRNGSYLFEFFEENSNLIRVKIHSRFVSKLIYNTWIKFTNESEKEPIIGWYCDCKSGSRVLGACAHVTSVIWYLGVERHGAGRLEKKMTNNFFNFVIDCDKDFIEDEDSTAVDKSDNFSDEE